MKMKTVFHLLGWKPKVKEYGFEINRFQLANEGDVDYAQWLHPKDTKKEILQDDVDQLKSFLTEGDVAIDIGAHTGDSTIPIALKTPDFIAIKIPKFNDSIGIGRGDILPIWTNADAKNTAFMCQYMEGSTTQIPNPDG